MSEGRFSRLGKYESDAGTIHPIRVQVETITTINVVPAGAVNSPVSARVSGGNRRIGLKARSITLRWADAPPEGYLPNALLRVPIFGAAVFASIQVGSTFPYLGVDAIVVGKNPERVR